MLITALDGELLGIRVEWRIKPQYLGCQFNTLRVELNHGQVGRDLSVDDRTADFSNEQLHCNIQYTPRVRAMFTESHFSISNSDDGTPLPYSGKTKQNMQSCILQNNCIVFLTLFCHCIGITTVNIELAIINCPTKKINK